MKKNELDIVIPVYNEESHITYVLDSFAAKVRSAFRVLICYDFDEDNTLPAAWEISIDGSQWYTVLVFPTIRFISPGKKQPGEDLLRRPVTGIWLE